MINNCYLENKFLMETDEKYLHTSRHLLFENQQTVAVCYLDSREIQRSIAKQDERVQRN